MVMGELWYFRFGILHWDFSVIIKRTFFDIKFSIISEKISNHISGENYVAVSYILFHGIYVFCIFNFRERIDCLCEEKLFLKSAVQSERTIYLIFVALL